METVLPAALDAVLLLLVLLVWRASCRREARLRDALLDAVAQAESRMSKRIDEATEIPEPDLGPILEKLESLERLVSLERSGPLAGRLAALEARVEEVVREPLAPDLGREIRPYLAEAMSSVDGRLEELRDELRRKEPAPAPEAEPAGAREFLLEQGYSEVRLLAEPGEGAGPVRIPVEARRDGMTYKGHVTVVDGRAEEASLTPVHRVFP